MVRNCHGNLARWPFHLVESRAFRAQTLPVFIVGAGPSLDADLAVIRRWREQVLLVSCGTTLGILLKHGLRPDIHVELERGALVYDLLAAVEQEHGFAGITLLASTTVDPRLGELFDKCWFFFRAGLSPGGAAPRGSAGVLRGADPLCCNAAFSAVAAMGFSRDLLLRPGSGAEGAGAPPRQGLALFRGQARRPRRDLPQAVQSVRSRQLRRHRPDLLGLQLAAGRCFRGSSGSTAPTSTTAATAPGSTAPSRRPRPRCASRRARRRGRWCCASWKPS